MKRNWKCSYLRAMNLFPILWINLRKQSTHIFCSTSMTTIFWSSNKIKQVLRSVLFTKKHSKKIFPICSWNGRKKTWKLKQTHLNLFTIISLPLLSSGFGTVPTFWLSIAPMTRWFPQWWSRQLITPFFLCFSQWLKNKNRLR